MCPEQNRDDVQGLPTTERIVLWALRAWVVGQRKRMAVDALIAERLEWIGAENLAPLFDAFIGMVALGAVRPLAIHCVCHRGLSEDERALLDALALAQSGRSFETVLLLRCFLAPTSATDAVRFACRIGEGLSQAGRVFDLRVLGSTQYALAAEDHRFGAVSLAIH